MDNKCGFCDVEENKDIFFKWLPAMFGLEKEGHDYNPDVTLFITDDNDLELCVMMGDDYLIKEKKKIRFCPFCGRILDFKNDNVVETTKIYSGNEMTAIAEVHAKDKRSAKIAVNGILKKLDEWNGEEVTK